MPEVREFKVEELDACWCDGVEGDGLRGLRKK